MPIEINIMMPRRRALFRPDFYWSKHCKLKEGYEHECYVLGAFQDNDGNSARPVFTCEFSNGKVFNVPTEMVRFVDTDEEVPLVDNSY